MCHKKYSQTHYIVNLYFLFWRQSETEKDEKYNREESIRCTVTFAIFQTVLMASLYKDRKHEEERKLFNKVRSATEEQNGAEIHLRTTNHGWSVFGEGLAFHIGIRLLQLFEHNEKDDVPRT